jgi:hypothetical protein
MPEVYTICHLLYIEDLNVYARTSRHLDQLIQIVEHFTTDIRMEFCLDKFGTLSMRCGKEYLEGLKNSEEIVRPKDKTDTSILV